MLDEKLTTHKCAECGYLSLRKTPTRELIEAEPCVRDHFQKKGFGGGEKHDAIPSALQAS